MSKDYYNILGVEKSATESEIKKAYRKLAMKYHPDKNPDDESAESKFKEASESYEVLSNPQKKQQYDQFGSVGNQSSMDMDDIFSNFGDMFGDIFGNSRQTNSRQQRGSDLKIKMTLNYLDVLNGVTKKVKLSRKHVCSTCSGTGGKETDNCSTCGGSGKKVHVQNTILGQVQSVSACNQCNGFGYSIKVPCVDCNSTGNMSKEETVSIEIPAGVESGMQLRQRGSGNYARNGMPGDLIIELVVDDMHGFDRSNSNIHTSLVISIPEAILGCEKVVKSIDGKELPLTINPGMQSGKKYRFNSQGLPDLNYKVRGDLICTVVIHIPKSISDEEKRIIEGLGESSNFKS